MGGQSGPSIIRCMMSLARKKYQKVLPNVFEEQTKYTFQNRMTVSYETLPFPLFFSLYGRFLGDSTLDHRIGHRNRSFNVCAVRFIRVSNNCRKS